MDDLDSLAERYLLGELGEEELEAAELRLEGEIFFHRVQLAEGELIDAYLNGELADGRRERFESHFLRSPARRRRLEVSRMLMADAQQQRRNRSPRRPAWMLGLAAALVLAVAAGSWSLVLRRDVAQVHPGLPGEELLVTLDLGIQRGEVQPSFPLSAELRPLRLRINADPRDLSAPVTILLRDARGEVRWRGKGEAIGEATVEVILPEGLPAGAYEVEVLAVPPVGEPTPVGYSYFELEDS